MPPAGRGSTVRRASFAIAAVAAGLLILSGFTGLSRHYGFAVNETESLPNWGFWLNKNVKGMAWSQGDYMAFAVPENPYYPRNMVFVKRVYGVPGDVVTIVGRDFFINGKFVGHAKVRSHTGAIAEMSGPGIIPAGKYFVGTPHPDSLDSRYKMIGLIDQHRLVGKGTPVM